MMMMMMLMMMMMKVGVGSKQLGEGDWFVDAS